MRRIIFIFIVGIVLGGCSLQPQRSGVEIISTPTAKVYIDGREAGMTPYKNNNLKPGDIEIKLVSSNGNEWTKQIRLENYSDTVIDWDLSDKSSGYILSLEKIGGERAGLLVNVVPDSAAIAIDGEIKGFSPLKIEDISSGDKQITISFPSYKSRTIFAKGITGFQLVIEAYLAQVNLPTANASPTPVKNDGLATQTMVTIKTTETGWLRVRETDSADGIEIGRVKPGEKYLLEEENNEWTKIKINEVVSGWVSSKYVAKDEL